MHTINLPYKQGYVTPVPAAVVVNTYEFREAENPSVSILLKKDICIHKNYNVLVFLWPFDYFYQWAVSKN